VVVVLVGGGVVGGTDGGRLTVVMMVGVLVVVLVVVVMQEQALEIRNAPHVAMGLGACLVLQCFQLSTIGDGAIGARGSGESFVLMSEDRCKTSCPICSGRI